MLSTQKCIIASFALIIGIVVGVSLAQIISVDDVPSYDEMIPIITHTADTKGFKEALLPLLQTRFGSTTTSYEPQKLIYTYPGLQPEDFHTVQAVNGTYEFRDGFLWYLGDIESGETANHVSDEGYLTLQKNVQTRLGDRAHVTSIELVKLLETSTEPVSEEPAETPIAEDPDMPVENPEEPTMCPMDAKMCPDGTFVGRTAPGCAFAECPGGGTSQTETLCTPEQRQAEACIEIYAPVCAAQQVQCITTPCEPVPTTYPNSCFACADESVISYTEGACSAPTTE